MKISFHFLHSFIDLDLPAQHIAKLLTSVGVEVEKIEPLSLKASGVVVGRIEEVKPHPTREDLTVLTLSDGDQTFQVVSKALNCKKGVLTAFAKPGATLETEEGETVTFKECSIQGVLSQGCLLSSKDLELSSDNEKVLEFASQYQTGADVAQIFSDTVFDIALTPNLGHVASVLGVARELSALTGKEVSIPPIDFQEDDTESIHDWVEVEIKDPQKCPRYSARVIRDVTVAESPEWIQRRLKSSGVRPVNNIVDATNYVLLELGQPLHAFDKEKISGKKIFVRRAEEGSLFKTLDGNERLLSSEDLLIADEEKPLAIAGIMGGEDSSITASTKQILLESAFFDPLSIRRSAKRLNLQTDASKRFERGVDPNSTLVALDRLTELILDLSGGRAVKGFVDCGKRVWEEKKISCRLSRIEKLLGKAYAGTEVEEIFKRLRFSTHFDGREHFTVKVPAFRFDLNEEVDLIEEVAKLTGYDNLMKESSSFTASRRPHSPLYLFEQRIRSKLCSFGLQEFITCDLISPHLASVAKEAMMSPEETLCVMNPSTVDLSILRTNLLPGLLGLVKYNLDHQNRNLSGFEIGKIHFKEKGNFEEQLACGILLTGKKHPPHALEKSEDVDFYTLKGLVENLLEALLIKNYSFENRKLAAFHPGRQASVLVQDLLVGSFGELHPSINRRLDRTPRIYFAEFDVEDLFQVKKAFSLKPIPLYPSTERDVTVKIDRKTPVEKLFERVGLVHSDLLEQVLLLGIYEGDKVALDKKNVTLRFIYRDREKTLSQEVADREHQKFVSQLN